MNNTIFLKQSGMARWVLLALLLLISFGAILVRLGPKRHSGQNTSSIPAPAAVRLVDVFRPEHLTGTAQTATTPASTCEWRFNAPDPADPNSDPLQGWLAGPGVADLRVTEGRLAGRSTSEWPLIHVQEIPGYDAADPLHAVEIRMRASAGANLAVEWLGDWDMSMGLERMTAFAKAGDRFVLSTPIVADDRFKTYTIPLRRLQHRTPVQIRRVLIRPTDVAGADFEIESVSLITRKAHLAGIVSGVSWQGLAGIYRQTLVTKTPEVVGMPVRLPERAWLDLALGTVIDGPVTFQVRLSGQGESTRDVTLLHRTLTTAHRWEPVRIDLSAYSGKEVILSMGLTAANHGTLGFWGSPVIRCDQGPAATARRDNPSRPTPQGVILIWADALRWDHLGVYGHPRNTAPALGLMAQHGTVFHDCLTQAPWTLPSTASLFTSLYPSTHRITDALSTDKLPVATVTLAELFQAAGYATLSFSSVHYTGENFNLHQGFEELHEAESLTELVDTFPSKTAREYVDRLLPWLEAHRDVPFFVFLHVFDAHMPYEPYAPFDRLWARPGAKRAYEGYVETVIGRKPRGQERFVPQILKIKGIDPNEFISVPKDWYDGSIRGMDAEFGRLFERLEQLGLDQRTLVLLTSDHGQEFFEHGGMGQGQSVYSELNHAPLILRMPGVVTQGAEVSETVRTIDLMPTLLELCDLPAPEGMQGRSLVPLLTGNAETAASLPTGGSGVALAAQQWTDEPAVSERAAGNPKLQQHAIILDGWKLIHNLHKQSGRPQYELYDHRKDPLDQVNLAEANPQVVDDLSQALKVWQAETEAARLAPDSDLEKNLSSEALKRLRSLGYIR